MPEFQPYFDSIALHYDKWWRLYTLTDAEGQEERSAESFFDFGLMVQTIVLKDEPEFGRPQTKIERFPVTEGLQKYAIDHALLVGRPGSGKSTALARLMLDLVKGVQIPVLVELRSYQSSILELIRSSFKRHDLNLTIAQIEMLLDDRRLILLVDGVNELPSESARIDLSNFRQNHSKIPMIFTTRDLSLGGNLGIEKQLEMQPLTETQMRSFINAYLPGKADAMLGQLKDRLREFGTTPLLLWMLCSLFKRTEVIPQNLGEVFRAFTRGYEQQIKQDVVLESDRRLWFDLLKQLAAAMMQGEKPTEFRVAIAPAEICAVFADYLKTENPLVPRQALDDLLKHHLIQRNGELVEFRHQLIQEYYAAEWLLERVGQLDDETLECDYLNYLKWTEPLALMLALVDDEALAVRVVERSLAVDLILGARLAGEVRSGFQEKTIELVNSMEVKRWLKVELLGRTRSEVAIYQLANILEELDTSVHRRAILALCQITFTSITPILLKASTHDGMDPFVKSTALQKLGSLSKSNPNFMTQELIIALNSPSVSLRLKSVEILASINNEAAALSLMASLKNDPDSDVRLEALFILIDMDSITRISALHIALKDSSPLIRQHTIYELGETGLESDILLLLMCLKDPDPDVRISAATALGKIGSKVSIPALCVAIMDTNPDVRLAVVEAFRYIKSEAVIPVLANTLESSHEDLRVCAAEILSNFEYEAVIPVLIDALENVDANV